MSNLTNNLNSYIDSNIYANGNGDITAEVLNSALKEIVTGIGTVESTAGSGGGGVATTSTFQFPNGTLTELDIGKVVMIGSTGVAELYMNNGEVPSAPREFQFILNETATLIEQTPVYGASYYKKSIQFSAAIIGESFKIIYGEELFTVTIDAIQDIPNMQVGLDPDINIFRTNLMDVINSFDSTLIMAYEDPNDPNIIDLIVPDPEGRVMVFVSSSPSFVNFGGVFVLEEFIPSVYSSQMEVFFTVDSEPTIVVAENWRGANTPLDADAEVALIVDYINLNFLDLTATVTGNPGEFTVVENAFTGHDIIFKGISYSSQVINRGNPTIPPLPTAFPLGKLVGIEGSQVVVSANTIEQYTLESPLSELDYTFLNTSTLDQIDFSNEDWFFSLANYLIIPTDNGLARPFDLNDVLGEEGILPETLRHAVLGLAIYSEQGSTSVTVVNTPFINHAIRALLTLLLGNMLD